MLLSALKLNSIFSNFPGNVGDGGLCYIRRREMGLRDGCATEKELRKSMYEQMNA